MVYYNLVIILLDFAIGSISDVNIIITKVRVVGTQWYPLSILSFPLYLEFKLKVGASEMLLIIPLYAGKLWARSTTVNTLCRS